MLELADALGSLLAFRPASGQANDMLAVPELPKACAQANDMGGALARIIGMTRAKAKIGMTNLAYNMRRSCCLAERLRFHRPHSR